MDYIQEDLELIRMASEKSEAGDKGKKTLKKRKNAGDLSLARLKSRGGAKAKTRAARKTLSPKQTKKGKAGLQEKEKKVRRSMGSNAKKSSSTLGKMRLPVLKKLIPQPPASAKKIPPPASPPKVALRVASSKKRKAHDPGRTRPVKEIPPPTSPPKVALRVTYSEKRKALDPDAVPIEGIHFEEGAKIEAVDCGQWYRGKIIQVDYQKMDILVHFHGWASSYDTWFPMTSALIRGPPTSAKKISPPASPPKVALRVASSKKRKAHDPGRTRPVKEIPPPTSPPKVALRVTYSEKRKALDPDAVPIEGIHFEEGAKIEAVDHGQWYRGKIIQVDYQKMDILVHFHGWASSYDTWFPMTSALIRGPPTSAKKIPPPASPPKVALRVASSKKRKAHDPGRTRPVKEIPPPTSPPKVALRVTYSEKRKALDPDSVPIEGIHFEEGAKIEAVDHGQWYRGKIIQVDYPKMDILVHFDGWGSRFDTWFPMTSALIRGRTQLDSKPDMPNYKSGEDVLATWTDGNFYPATVLNVKSSGSCQVMYFDGVKKLVRPNLIKKMTEKEKKTAMQAAQKLLLTLPEDIGSTASSGSPATPVASSEFRRYKTFAYDREGRIAARSGTAEPANFAKRTSSDGGAFVAKKPRLDKVVNKPVIKVSQHSENNKEKIPQFVATRSANKEKYVKADSSQPSKHDDEFSAPTAPKPARVSETTQCTSVVRGRKHSSKREDIARLSEQKPKGSTKPRPRTQKDKQLNKSAGTKLSYIATKVSEESVLPSDDSSSSPAGDTNYKVGDIVLAKWEDCRSYLAYIIRKESPDHYKIRYYDGMVKTINNSFIHPWIGPLPDALKSFKHKAPASKSLRSRSIDFKSARSKSVTATTIESKAVLPRRRTIPGAKTEFSPPPPLRRRLQSETKETAPDTIQYAIGEKVISKWSDLNWYPATIVSKIDNEYYEVRYHDKMTKIVRDTWLNRWAPTPIQKSKSKPAVKVPDKSTETLSEDEHGQEHFIAERKTGKVEDKTKKQTASVLQDDWQPQIMSAQPKTVGRKKLSYAPGNSVLARFTDGKKYPATVKECLEHQQYFVEFDNGVRCTVKKSSMLKPWNPLALPPMTKYYKKKLGIPQVPNTVPSCTFKPLPSSISINLKVTESDDTKEKPARLRSSKSSQIPRQVVRDYSSYYSRLPKQAVDTVERQLLNCRVPGCTKRFRKEDMLRQHHRLYHQKRYNLRYHKNDPVPVKRKSSKAENIRRRVSADYEILSQNLDLLARSVANTEKQPLPSQGSLVSAPMATNVGGETKVSEKSGFKDTIKISTPSEFLPSTPKEPTVNKKRGRKRRCQMSTKSTGAIESSLEEILATPPEGEDGPPPASNEDVIRCSCRSEEEEGLMIQCEGCFTWQHILCTEFNHTDKQEGNDDNSKAVNTRGRKSTILKSAIDSESYICWICKNPQNVRKSRKYLYSNYFLLKGKLPSLANMVNVSKQMDKSSKGSLDPASLTSLLDEVTKMQEALYCMKQKIKLAKAVDENLLLTTWEDLGVVNNDKMSVDIEEGQPSSAADKDGDAAHVSRAQVPENKQKPRRKLSNGKECSLPQKMSGENHKAYMLRCRENLLDHIAQMEAELSDRITRLTDLVSTCQSSSGEKEGGRVHDLQRDLSVVQALLAKC